MKKWFAVWMLVLAGNTIAQSVTGDIIGKVMNFNDDKPLPNARAVVEDQDKNTMRLQTQMGASGFPVFR